MSSYLKLTKGKVRSLVYHDIFDYPLTFEELGKWEMRENCCAAGEPPVVEKKEEYYFLKGRSDLVKKRLENEEFSLEKLKRLNHFRKYFFLVPSLRFVGITGSMAMNNADSGSDIDLLLITKTGTMWSTRLITTLILKAFLVPLRKYGDRVQKDKLCLNMWIDERDIVWPAGERNIFTAHEIAQIVPLINKDSTYERLIGKNRWILDYWPKAAKETSVKERQDQKFRSGVFEKLAYYLQKQHMGKKITNETVSPTRAFFHPKGLSGEVLSKLQQRLK